MKKNKILQKNIYRPHTKKCFRLQIIRFFASIIILFPFFCLHRSRLQWNQVLDSTIGTNFTSVTSRELQLLLERKRLPALGINSYEFHKKSGKIIFQACNSLYMCLDTGFKVIKVVLLIIAKD
jgi:hypothetical protein